MMRIGESLEHKTHSMRGDYGNDEMENSLGSQNNHQEVTWNAF